MKRSAICFLFILLFPLASAISLDMKENFQPGETFLATIEGNFLTQITPENVYFYSERVSMPLVFNIARIQEKYYIYALLPLQEKNYTLIIKNAHYLENRQEYTKDIEKNFSVSGNITDFSVYPGFIITKNNFTLTLESNNQAVDVSIQVQNISQSIRLPASGSKKSSLSVQADNFTLSSISVSGGRTSHSIPIAILPSSGQMSVSILEPEKFRFSISKSSLYLAKGKEASHLIYLINAGSEDITIKLSLEGSLATISSIDSSEISIPASESKEIKVKINPDYLGYYQGTLKAESGNFSSFSAITLNVTENETQITQASKESCIVYGGAICPESQKCSGSVADSLEGACCIGKCEEKTSYTGIIIGIIIILAVAVAGFFLYKRYKKSKSPSSREIMLGKSREFEKRLGIETRGSLSRS